MHAAQLSSRCCWRPFANLCQPCLKLTGCSHQPFAARLHLGCIQHAAHALSGNTLQQDLADVLNEPEVSLLPVSPVVLQLADLRFSGPANNAFIHHRVTPLSSTPLTSSHHGKSRGCKKLQLLADAKSRYHWSSSPRAHA